MSAAVPLDLAAPSAPAPSPAEGGVLSPEDAAYLRSFAMFLEEDEARNPGVMDREIAAARLYGTDFEREMADIEAGRHPLQQPG
jgi:hypothetical protein